MILQKSFLYADMAQETFICIINVEKVVLHNIFVETMIHVSSIDESK